MAGKLSLTTNEKRNRRKSSALLMSPSQVFLARGLQFIFRHGQRSWPSGPSRCFTSSERAGGNLEDKTPFRSRNSRMRTTRLARIPL
jgi:hypothetical protein